jgi:argininosuccinate lyase
MDLARGEAIIRRPVNRFRKEPDPRFWRLNRSVEFDWRLAPYDIDQSRAHARALADLGVLSPEELEKLDDGLVKVSEEMETIPTRTSTWRSNGAWAS